MTAKEPIRHRGSLRGKIAALVALGMTAVVVLTAATSHFVAVTSMDAARETDLWLRAYSLEKQVRHVDAVDEEQLAQLLRAFRENNPGYRVAVSLEPRGSFAGDPLPVTDVASPVGGTAKDIIESRGELVAALHSETGVSVVVAQDRSDTAYLKTRLLTTLLAATGGGLLLAGLTAYVVGRTTTHTPRRLQRQIDRMATTGELELLEAPDDEEYYELTLALNRLIDSLADSRRRQAQLVADAGHELRTPITSARTNIELLLMLLHSGQVSSVPPSELKDLEDDVLAQLEEMSVLITDLVDLAREESDEREFEPVRLDEVLAEALERVQRRRPDVRFLFHADAWVIDADRMALSRAPVNLLDNAAKWSPHGGVVRVSLRAGQHRAVLVVDDSGPGIPVAEREMVLERFYRAEESRALPGSGLGLSIAKQTLEHHGAELYVEESDDGGTRMRVVFPGHPVPLRDTAG